MNTSPPKSDTNEFWTGRRFLLVLSATVLALFPKVALGLNTFFFRDFGALGYPGAHFFRESLLHGSLPLWDPYSHCGVPYMAQMGQWYVPLWINVLLPMPWSVTFPMLLHVILGGFGMFCLMRRWGLSGFPAAFAGFAYTFNGISLTSFQWGNYLASYGWLPWVVMWVMLAWREGGRWIVLATIASTLQVLTATPELTLLGWTFLALVWLSQLIGREIKFWPSAGRVAAVVVLTSGVVMVQILPFMDLLSHSQRDTNYDQLRWAMPGWGWANLLVPLFHYFQSYQHNWYQQGQEFFLSYYLGAGVMVLALGGAIWTRRAGLSLVIIGMALFCWIMALGDDGHLYTWVKKVCPLVGIARFPVKYTTLTMLLVPILAAYGLQRLENDAGKRTRSLVFGITAIFLVLMGFIVWFARTYYVQIDNPPMTTRSAIQCGLLMIVFVVGAVTLVRFKDKPARYAIQFALLGIIIFDAWTHNPNILPTASASILRPGIWEEDSQGTDSAHRPSLKPGEGRMMISPDAESQLADMHVESIEGDFVGRRVAEWSNLNLLDMVPKVTGALTLRPGYWDRLEHYIYYTPGSSYSPGFLDFVSAAWISSPDNPVVWVARTNYLPVMTCGQKPVFLSDTNALLAMTASNYNPRAEVYLPETERDEVTVSNQTSCGLSDVQFDLNRINANVDAAETSLVVLSQTYYHLWHVTVDGQETPLLRANVAFTAFQVPAGKHHLELVYRDTKLKIGAVISLLSIAICCVVFVRSKPLSANNKS